MDMGYLPDTAHNAAFQRKRRNTCRLLLNQELLRYVKTGLEACWSPEQISGRLRTEPDKFGYICPESIYRYVYGYNKELCKLLPRRQARRISKLDRHPHPANIGNERPSIRNRPPSVRKRAEVGHWEGDTVFFTHRTKQNLTVLVERKSRYVKLRRNTWKEPEQVNRGIVDILGSYPAVLRKSLTLDMGAEFGMPLYLRGMLGINVWYCDPASPNQKGTVENTNGRLRRFMPKSLEIESVPDSRLVLVEHTMNATPRKILGYRTPAEVFGEYLAEIQEKELRQKNNRCT